MLILTTHLKLSTLKTRGSKTAFFVFSNKVTSYNIDETEFNSDWLIVSETRRIQIKPLNVSSLPSSSSSDVTSYPPNASLEMGPGGTMVPTLKSASKHTPPSTYTVNSTASSASSPSASCGQQNSPGSISSAHTTTAVTTASKCDKSDENANSVQISQLFAIIANPQIMNYPLF